jgi:two-component system response regulator MprA
VSGDTPCVLVVDDDPVIRQFVRAVLEGLDFRIEEAADGAEALQRAAECAPDVVILDVMMPGMDGLEVAKRLSGSSASLLMLTGVDDPDVEASLMDAGAVAYLTKPFSPRELLDRIESLVTR